MLKNARNAGGLSRGNIRQICYWQSLPSSCGCRLKSGCRRGARKRGVWADELTLCLPASVVCVLLAVFAAGGISTLLWIGEGGFLVLYANPFSRQALLTVGILVNWLELDTALWNEKQISHVSLRWSFGTVRCSSVVQYACGDFNCSDGVGVVCNSRSPPGLPYKK